MNQEEYYKYNTHYRCKLCGNNNPLSAAFCSCGADLGIYGEIINPKADSGPSGPTPSGPTSSGPTSSGPTPSHGNPGREEFLRRQNELALSARTLTEKMRSAAVQYESSILQYENLARQMTSAGDCGNLQKLYNALQWQIQQEKNTDAAFNSAYQDAQNLEAVYSTVPQQQRRTQAAGYGLAEQERTLEGMLTEFRAQRNALQGIRETQQNKRAYALEAYRKREYELQPTPDPPQHKTEIPETEIHETDKSSTKSGSSGKSRKIPKWINLKTAGAFLIIISLFLPYYHWRWSWSWFVVGVGSSFWLLLLFIFIFAAIPVMEAFFLKKPEKKKALAFLITEIGTLIILAVLPLMWGYALFWGFLTHFAGVILHAIALIRGRRKAKKLRKRSAG